MKQQLIQQQSGQEPMYHLELPGINASHVTDGGDDTAVRFRLLPRARQLSIDGQTADLAILRFYRRLFPFRSEFSVSWSCGCSIDESVAPVSPSADCSPRRVRNRSTPNRARSPALVYRPAAAMSG